MKINNIDLKANISFTITGMEGEIIYQAAEIKDRTMEELKHLILSDLIELAVADEDLDKNKHMDYLMNEIRGSMKRLEDIE